MDVISKATERMAELIRGGMAGGVAAQIAEDEYGLDVGDIARACAARSVEAQSVRRRDRGVLTQAEVAELLRGRMTAPKFRADVRRAVRLTVLAVMTADRSVRDLRSELAERADGLDEDGRLIYWNELHEIWSALPADLDPREVRRATIPMSSFMWRAMACSPIYRWVPANG
jgi:hypothetical protein